MFVAPSDEASLDERARSRRQGRQPREAGRSAATRLDGRERTRTLSASTAPAYHNILWSTASEKPAHSCARQQRGAARSRAAASTRAWSASRGPKPPCRPQLCWPRSHHLLEHVYRFAPSRKQPDFGHPSRVHGCSAFPAGEIRSNSSQGAGPPENWTSPRRYGIREYSNRRHGRAGLVGLRVQ